MPVSLIDEKTAERAKKLGIDPYSMVFIKGKPLSDTEGDRAAVIAEAIAAGSRIDFCPFVEDDGIITVSEPELVTFAAVGATPKTAKYIARKNRRHLRKPEFLRRRLYDRISRSLDKARFRILNAYMKAAMADRMFIARFNDGEFYNHLSLKGGRVGHIEAEVLMTGKGANKYVNIADRGVRTANIALYAIACKGFPFEDMYSVGTVFTFQQNRNIDVKKADAANEFFKMTFCGEKHNLIKTYTTMSEAFLELPVVPVNMRDIKLLRDNYVRYAALANLARGYEIAMSANSDFRRKVRKNLIKKYWTINDRISFFAGYRKVTEACELIAAAEDYDNEDLLLAFEEACSFEKEVEDRLEKN